MSPNPFKEAEVSLSPILTGFVGVGVVRVPGWSGRHAVLEGLLVASFAHDAH